MAKATHYTETEVSRLLRAKGFKHGAAQLEGKLAKAGIPALKTAWGNNRSSRMYPIAEIDAFVASIKVVVPEVAPQISASVMAELHQKLDSLHEKIDQLHALWAAAPATE